jgi:transcriptional regulator GlxA family with amidase domain
MTMRKLYLVLIFMISLLCGGGAFASEAAMKTLGVVIYPQFELLDVFGPLEMFGQLPDRIRIVMIAEKKGPVKSAQGPSVLADTDFKHAPHIDYLFVPGGMGSRSEVNNTALLNWIKQVSSTSELTISVCTGAALLAKAGVLNHHKATTNKMAFDWVMQQGPEVNWVRSARWVDDGKFITSSGVAAGIDMSLHVIDRLYGESESRKVAHDTEYVWNDNPAHDEFAKH